MIYLKEFATAADYNTAKSGLIAPNVSYIVDGTKVEYMKEQPIPPTPAHDYVEIGGIKWATMNIGAESVTDTGLHYQWGDTVGYTADQVGSDEGQKYFGCNDYKYTYESEGDCMFGKYDDRLTTLQPEDDAATAAWGGKWRMPTKSEFDTLINATTSAWTNSYQGSGTKGVILTDKTDSSKVLFFPAAGRFSYGYVSNEGYYYWTNELNAEVWDYGNSEAFAFNDDNDEYPSIGRNHGISVRAILDE
jgi:uncharacterized protein (TIGR02145 family)